MKGVGLKGKKTSVPNLNAILIKQANDINIYEYIWVQKTPLGGWKVGATP